MGGPGGHEWRHKRFEGTVETVECVDCGEVAVRQVVCKACETYKAEIRDLRAELARQVVSNRDLREALEKPNEKEKNIFLQREDNG